MSCLFNSLASSVGMHPTSLRLSIVSFLQTNPKLLDDIKASDIVDWTEGVSLQEYASKMAQPWTWGGAIEIKAFCELFHVDVTIHVLYTGKNFSIKGSQIPKKTIHIAYNGSHFSFLYV